MAGEQAKKESEENGRGVGQHNTLCFVASISLLRKCFFSSHFKQCRHQHHVVFALVVRALSEAQKRRLTAGLGKPCYDPPHLITSSVGELLCTVSGLSLQLTV